MAESSSGTVTFLFTDLVGSTRLWEAHPEAMEGALARHDAILRGAVESHSGDVVKNMGDGGFAVFATARDALTAAVAGQLGLTEEPWGPTGRLRVRMGLHTGEAQCREGDYFGTALNRAGRLMGVAHGGQIVCSQATADLVRDVLPEDLDLVDLGEHRLRDLLRPERVFQVIAPGLDAEFAALTSLNAFPGNLPLQVSSFIGREQELERIAKALDEARVVTLTGVGGVGKTRLALQVAADVLPTFREGAWLVELQALRDPDGVGAAFAAVFAVTARAGQRIEESVVEFLRAKQLLLVVDNCEHLLEAVADLVELVQQSCPGIVVLATSREGLALDGERVVPVPSLRAPADDDSIDAIAHADAVRLFVERAASMDPDFDLTADNAGAVVQICRRLDGVPLAIELAAARLTTMTAAELLHGLDRRFETLAGGRRRAVQRHQTLRAAIDWSYGLCTELEQPLLARLAVFAGGCTRDAIEAVCACEPLDRPRVFELLAGLVTKSLVVAQREGAETRYRLLETIREYGEERLAELAETETMRDRHAEYYAALTGEIAAELLGPRQMEAGRRLGVEGENMRAAMAHAIDTRDVDVALRLLQHTPGWGAPVGYALRLPLDALEFDGADEHPLYARGLILAAGAAVSDGEPAEARARCDDAIAAARRLGDPDGVVEELVAAARSLIAISVGAWADAAIELEHNVEVARSNGRPTAGGLAIGALARTMAGDAAGAVPLATEGLAAARASGNPGSIVMNLDALAGALADEDPERAAALLRESLQLATMLGYENIVHANNAILTTARIGDWAEVLELAPVCIRVMHWTTDRPLLGGIFNVIGRALATIDPAAAAVLQGAARRLATMAIPAPSAATDRPTGGGGFIAELRRTTTGMLNESLGEARLRELRAEGDVMSNDDAVAFALDAIDRASKPGASARNAP